MGALADQPGFRHKLRGHCDEERAEPDRDRPAVLPVEELLGGRIGRAGAERGVQEHLGGFGDESGDEFAVQWSSALQECEAYRYQVGVSRPAGAGDGAVLECVGVFLWSSGSWWMYID